MSFGTVLLLFGLLIALAGIGGVLLARVRPATAAAGPAEDLALANDFSDLARAVRSIDRRIRLGVVVAVLGLLLAGIGAYLGSDARALGADVGRGGSGDDARVGGSW